MNLKEEILDNRRLKLNVKATEICIKICARLREDIDLFINQNAIQLLDDWELLEYCDHDSDYYTSSCFRLVSELLIMQGICISHLDTDTFILN